jgi:RsiW-degrading membrane proteinase PrsW (M82 family)
MFALYPGWNSSDALFLLFIIGMIAFYFIMRSPSSGRDKEPPSPVKNPLKVFAIGMLVVIIMMLLFWIVLSYRGPPRL